MSLVMLLGITVYTYMSISNNHCALFWTSYLKTAYIFFPYQYHQRYSNWPDQNTKLLKISLSLIWDSVLVVVCDWEPKRLSKVVVFQRGTHVMFSSPHRHTTKRIPNSNFLAKWKKWKKGFGFGFCFHGRGLKTISITSCNFSLLA